MTAFLFSAVIKLLICFGDEKICYFAFNFLVFYLDFLKRNELIYNETFLSEELIPTILKSMRKHII